MPDGWGIPTDRSSTAPGTRWHPARARVRRRPGPPHAGRAAAAPTRRETHEERISEETEGTTTAEEAASPSIWDLLTKNPRYGLLWLGQTLSRLGNYVYGTAIGVLAYQVTGSGSAVAVVVGAFSVVQLVLILLGGVVADRLPRRLIIGGTDLAACLLVGGIGLWAAMGSPELWALVVVSALLGVLAALHLPAYRAIAHEVVDDADLPASAALSALVNPMTVVAGPALGAALMAFGGVAMCLLADAVSFGVAVLLLLPALRGRPVERPAHPAQRAAGMAGIITDVRAGPIVIRERPVLRTTIVAAAVAVACVDAPVGVLLPVLVADAGWSDWVVGATGAAIGLGTAAGAPLLLRLPDRHAARAHGWAMTVAGLPLLVGVLMSALTGWLVAAVCYGGLVAVRYIRQTLISSPAPGTRSV
ncbi:MFS transporter [Streptomyces sp. NPDC001732]